MPCLKEEITKSDLPRERFEKEGISVLSNLELMMIIIGSGNKHKNVYTLATEVLKALEECMQINNNLFDLTYLELIQIKGIGYAKAMQIVSVFELSRRLFNQKKNKVRFNQPKDIFEIYKSEFIKYEEEHLHVLYFDSKLNLKIKKEISIGGLNSTFISPNVILKWALKFNSIAILLIHNHPSGDPKPSKNDELETMKIIEAANLMGITVIDHIIFGKEKYFSFLENNVLK